MSRSLFIVDQLNMPEIKPGAVLIATPKLQDPHFERSVVLILTVDQEGCVGLILNRPSPLTCEAVARELELSWNAPQQQLLIGGPVEGRGLWFLHMPHSSFDHQPITESISVSRSREALETLCGAQEQALRLYSGYAGWGPEQLEREISRGDWWVGTSSHELIFDCTYEEVWSEALRLMGVDPLCLIYDHLELAH